MNIKLPNFQDPIISARKVDYIKIVGVKHYSNWAIRPLQHRLEILIGQYHRFMKTMKRRGILSAFKRVSMFSKRWSRPRTRGHFVEQISGS